VTESETIWICDKCAERSSTASTIEHRYPDVYQDQRLIDFSRDMLELHGMPEPELKRYHVCGVYAAWGGYSGTRLCGPMHPETEQEYFIHWVGGSMNFNDKRK